MDQKTLAKSATPTETLITHKKPNALSKVCNTYLKGLHAAGIHKVERVSQNPQGTDVIVDDIHRINFCANNYLGLANHPRVVQAAMVSVWHQSVSFVVPKTSIRNWKESSLTSIKWKILSYIHLALMLTLDSSKLFLMNKIVSSAMHLTMLLLLMELESAKPKD
jgi:hypothetical protein